MEKQEAELCFGGNLVSPVHSPELRDSTLDKIGKGKFVAYGYMGLY